MKFLSNLFLATALGAMSLAAFANEKSDIPAEIIQQLPAIESTAPTATTPTLPTALPEEEVEAPVATDAQTESDAASAEAPEVIPTEKP